MRICLVYDCLFPHTIGGAERWYRNLALRLASEGHEVTYVTLRQWKRAAGPDLPGVHVVAAGPRMRLYAGPGQRRVVPPVLFGAGVLWHLVRHGRRYDVVHTASFPYFSVLAAAAARRLGRYRLVVDWHEFWSREYWRRYLGVAGGSFGWLVQKCCLRVRQQAFCFAHLTAERLRAQGIDGEVHVLEGEYDGPLEARSPLPAEPRVVFAGRHIPEKRAPAAVAAVAAAREALPGLRGSIFGEGPERPAVLAAIAAHGLEEVVEAPGFVDHERLQRTLAGALCLLHPSSREGYGMVVVESAALGVPTILVAGEDNAATELVEPGVNGLVAESAEPAVLASAILEVADRGAEMRASTSDWFRRNARRLSLDASLDGVLARYEAIR